MENQMNQDHLMLLVDLKTAIDEFKLKITQTETSFEATKKAHLVQIDAMQRLVAQLESVADKYNEQIKN